jgi:hypothetical protein
MSAATYRAKVTCRYGGALRRAGEVFSMPEPEQVPECLELVAKEKSPGKSADKAADKTPDKAAADKATDKAPADKAPDKSADKAPGVTADELNAAPGTPAAPDKPGKK